MDGSSPAPVRPGDILAGKYRVERLLGQGGMGVVVAAHHIHLDERVAIKFLLPQALGNPEAIQRFEREARAAVKIKSEHVARVSDVGRLETGAPYMVMEYLDGGDLADWMRQRGAMGVEQAVEFVLQACEAIAEAHALGIVHRDLKPANLFCVRRADGVLSVKVLDFGISKVTNASGTGPDVAMTRTQAVIGSPLYMSPEQLQSSRTVDARTDLWALGVILFELVTGRPPFYAEGLPELVYKIATEGPPPLRSLRPDAPPALDGVIARCLEKDRNRRLGSIADLALALQPFAPARARPSIERVIRVMEQAAVAAGARRSSPSFAGSASQSGSGPAMVAGSSGTSASWGQTSGAPKSTGRVVLVAAVIGVVLVGGGAAAFFATRAPAAASSTTAATTPSSLPETPTPGNPPPAAPPASSLATVTLPPPPPATPPEIASSAPSAAPSAVAPSVPVPTPATHPTGQPTRPPPQATAVKTDTKPPPPKTNCDPPYYVDSAGHRQYKPQCL